MTDLSPLLALRAEVPSKFLDFCRWLGIKLTPAQHVLSAVAFDGLDPIDLGGVHRALAKQLFGDVDRFPREARHVLVAVCGARGGKSYVLSALRMLHLALTVSLATLAPGEVAVALIVAPDKRLARQVLRYALGAISGMPSLKRLVQSSTADGFVLKREEGPVSVEVLPATRGGSAVRGRSLVGAVLDECAFFRDDSYQVNDAEVYRAVAPRVLRGGQLVLASTPWAEQGLLWDFHSRNHEHPVDAISAHAPTLLLRDDEHTRGYVQREQDRDPANAAREFGAEFMGTTGESFFDGDAIKSSIDDKLVMPVHLSHTTASAGADMGFRSDSSALVIALRDQARVVVADIHELRPTKGKPLKPSGVVASFAEVVKGYAGEYVVADAHYRQAIVEHLEDNDLALVSAPEGANGKAETYQAVRALLREGRIRLPAHDRLIRQLREVTARPTAGGGISIVSPRWRTGGHGDLVSAMVLAVWDAARGLPVEVPVQHAEPREREAAAWEASIAANISKAERESSEADGFEPVW